MPRTQTKPAPKPWQKLKAKLKSSTARRKTPVAGRKPLLTPTSQIYTALERAFDHFNKTLFDGELPRPLFTLRKHARSYGYFSSKRFNGTIEEDYVDEIAMNPQHFKDLELDYVMSILVHEMVHLWQAHFGVHVDVKTPRAGYHNKEWGAKMESLGLMPSNTGKPGGKRTGQQMDHYIIKGAQFERAFIAGNFKRLSHYDVAVDREKAKAKRKVVYQCSICECKVWGKPGLVVFCNTHTCDMTQMQPDVVPAPAQNPHEVALAILERIAGGIRNGLKSINKPIDEGRRQTVREVWSELSDEDREVLLTDPSFAFMKAKAKKSTSAVAGPGLFD